MKTIETKKTEETKKQLAFAIARLGGMFQADYALKNQIRNLKAGKGYANRSVMLEWSLVPGMVSEENVIDYGIDENIESYKAWNKSDFDGSEKDLKKIERKIDGYAKQIKILNDELEALKAKKRYSLSEQEDNEIIDEAKKKAFTALNI